MKLVTEKELEESGAWYRVKSDANLIKFHLINMLQDHTERPFKLFKEGREVRHYMRISADKVDKKEGTFLAEIFDTEENRRQMYINVDMSFLKLLKNLRSKDPEDNLKEVCSSYMFYHEGGKEYTLTTGARPYMRGGI